MLRCLSLRTKRVEFARCSESASDTNGKKNNNVRLEGKNEFSELDDSALEILARFLEALNLPSLVVNLHLLPVCTKRKG